MIINNLDILWNWNELCKIISVECINKLTELGICESENFFSIFNNPNITFEYIIQKELIKENLNVIALNEFRLEKNLFYQSKYLEFHKTKMKNVFDELLSIILQPNNYDYFKYLKLIDNELFNNN